MRRLLTVFFVLLGLVDLWAQEYVKGLVLRSDNGEPVPFVNVIIPDLGKGAVANGDGRFNFRLPEGFRGEMEVVFSHVGFEVERIKLRSLMDGFVEVRLSPSEYDLDQAVVLSFDPKKIMERAKENLVNTQYGTPYDMDIFYREIVWGNGKVQGLTRAKGSFHTEGFHLHQVNKPSTSGHHYHFMAFDHIQKTDYGILNGRTGRARSAIGDRYFPGIIFQIWGFRTNWFDYELKGGKKFGDRDVYVLTVKGKNPKINNRAVKWGHNHYGLLENAVFYIDQEDYGVHMIEFSQSYSGVKEYRKASGHTNAPKKRESLVQFQRNKHGQYLFAYANYSEWYTDYGYDTEDRPQVIEVKDYAEVHVLDYDFSEKDTKDLKLKYHAPVVGNSPDRRLNYHADWYNRWIFISGKARYNPNFWEQFVYPEYPGEKEFEKVLAMDKPLEEQYRSFSNNQMYLLPLLRRRHGKTEGIWNRTGLHPDGASY